MRPVAAISGLNVRAPISFSSLLVASGTLLKPQNAAVFKMRPRSAISTVPDVSGVIHTLESMKAFFGQAKQHAWVKEKDTDALFQFFDNMDYTQHFVIGHLTPQSGINPSNYTFTFDRETGKLEAVPTKMSDKTSNKFSGAILLGTAAEPSLCLWKLPKLPLGGIAPEALQLTVKQTPAIKM